MSPMYIINKLIYMHINVSVYNEKKKISTKNKKKKNASVKNNN